MNEYFQTGAVPAPSSPGASSVMRQEFANIAAGFDKLPVLAGHAGEIVFVDATGSRLETNGSVFTDLVTLAGTQILTNKTIAWASNTFAGFNDAATKVAGTGAGEVLLLAEADKLPALDGSLLTNLNQGSLSTVSIAKGGTGATDLTGAQANLGINLKADADNAVLTGAPTAPTPLTGDASARIATTYFVADTMQAIGAFGPSSMNPLMNGVVSPGVAVLGSRSDHVHPTDTTRVSKAGDTMTGLLTLSIAGEGGELRLHNPTHNRDVTIDQWADGLINQARIFWFDGPGSTLPVQYFFESEGLWQNMVQGTKAGHLTRKDYVDTYAIAPLALKAPLASPTFTGTPAAPTPATSDNTTKVATTAFVQSLLAQQPPAGMQPSNSTPLMDGTAAAGTGVEGSRYDHVHPSDTSKLSLSGGTMTGNVSGIAPSNAAHLVRKDYCDAGSAIRVRRTTDQSLTPNGDRVILFDTSDIDIDSAYSSATGRFTPKVAGYYKINAQIECAPSAGASLFPVSLTIYKNNSIYASIYNDFNGNQTFTWRVTTTINDIVYLNGSTDYVDIRANINIAGSVKATYNHANRFSAALIKRA